MEPRFYFVFITALVPLIVGFVWYNPKVLGTAWMKESGITEERLRGANMSLIFGLTYLLGIFLSAAMLGIVIHQMGFFSMLQDDPNFKDPNSPNGILFREVMAVHGHSFRTFRHGALHGALAALMFSLPLLGINAMFERKSVKYIAIHLGYWIITLTIIGAILCHFV